MKNLKQAMIVVFASEDGETGWAPLRPEEVPAWVKDEDVLGNLLAGDIAQDPQTGDGRWFRAQRVANTAMPAANDLDGAQPAPVIVMPPRMPVVAAHDIILPGDA